MRHVQLAMGKVQLTSVYGGALEQLASVYGGALEQLAYTVALSSNRLKPS